MDPSKPNISNKDKLKNKPKIGAGSKEEKRKMKKEKLAQNLQKKNEEKIVAEIPEKKWEAPVSFGKDFRDSLYEVMDADVSNMVRKPTKRQKALNAVDQMKQFYATSDFSNPRVVFEEVDVRIQKKTINLQRKNEEEEEKRIRREMREKERNEQ